MYTNFYYAKSTAGGATSITLHFTGSKTYVVAAVSEVAGLDPSAPLDSASYHESLSSTTPWSSASLATTTANEYLFAWAADEWNNPSCSNPTAGWTETQNTAGATLCLLDRTVSAAGFLSGLSHAERRIQLRHGAYRLQGRVIVTGARAADHLDSQPAGRNSGNGIFRDARSHGRSFTIHMVRERPSHRPFHKQHRNDQRHTDRGGYIFRIDHGPRFQ